MCLFSKLAYFSSIQVCGASDSQLPPNFIKLPKDAYTPDFMAASDCMLGQYENFSGRWTRYHIYVNWLSLHISGKIGYGTVSEALAYKLPFVFVRRDYFNEEPFLRNMLEVRLLLPFCFIFYFHDHETVFVRLKVFRPFFV